MRRLFLLLPVVLNCVAFGQTPERTVQKFVDELNSKQLDSAVHLVMGGSMAPAITAAIVKDPHWPTYEISSLAEKVNGDRATVTYRLGLKNQPAAVHSETVSLIKSGSGWLIAPPSAPSDHDTLAAIAYALAHPHEAIQRGHQAAEDALCLSNVKQLDLAVIMFSNDFDDKLAMTSVNWKSKISPYVRNASLFTCARDPKGTVSYSFNAKLAGKAMAGISRPAETVLVYEGKNGHLDFRHGGRAAVGFADGHAKLLSKEQAKKLSWKP
ncbi:MAG TPA: hypothetical protein VG944_16875 [Fimbriimonas sp.]|nr:hypothetical protein [Fimbriimonas sp.]